MADKAIKLGETHLDLLLRRSPTLPPSQWETNYKRPFDISESPNKQMVSNMNLLIWAFEHGDFVTVDAILDWLEWLAEQLFMPKECLTGEEVYRSLTALPCLTAAGVAGFRNRPGAFAAAAKLARAHIAWALLGLGPVPGREVADHHLDSVTEPCVLIGTKKAKFPIRRVAQAGKRGWVRNREKNQPKKFQFIEHLAHSVMVYQALDLKIERKVRKACKWPVAAYEAVCKRFPRVYGWCFSAADRLILNRFAEDPTNRSSARLLLDFLMPTSLPVAFWRYADGSVVSLLMRGDSSSTDSLMIDAAYANGEVRMTSADDGLRIPAIRQIAFEETAAFACKAIDGTGPTMRVPKPSAALAHVIASEDGRTVLVGDGPGDVTAPPPVTPPHAEPPPVSDPCPIWMRWLGLCR